MEYDDATNEPINTCSKCGKQVVGWIDNLEEEFYCEECEDKYCDDCGAILEHGKKNLCMRYE